MPISPPVPKDTRSRLADWLEVECLVAPEGVTASRVRRLWASLDESGHETERDLDAGDVLETEILEEEPASCEAGIADEMEWRTNVLGPLYPFRLETSRANWRLVRASSHEDESVQAGRVCYLFCLLVSALRDSRIPGSPTGTLVKDAERDFERVAASAGAGVLGGETISFGWPRDDRTNFRQAVTKTSEKLGWKPRGDNPLWSKGKEKDAGVDLIAWRDFSDRRPGRLLLFGQAASGGEWAEKGVDPSGLFNWFSETPVRHYVPALFTPFPQHHECDGREGHVFEEVAYAEAWKREQKCGLVLDRLRIVEMAADHLARTGRAGTPPALDRVEEWVERAREAAGG